MAKRGDWAGALQNFKQAAVLWPDNATIAENVQYAQAIVDKENERIAKDKAAADKMKAAAASLANSINATTSNGLDFDGGKTAATDTTKLATTGNGGPCPTTSELAFGDPKVVDARCTKEPLSRVLDGDLKVHLDDAISIVYKNAPAGIEERVRKAFQAITTNDWKVAELWLNDAIKRDPQNANLKHLLAVVVDSQKGPQIVLPDPKRLDLRPDDPATNVDPEKWASYYIQDDNGYFIRVPDGDKYWSIKAYYAVKGVDMRAPGWVERPTYVIGIDNQLIRVPKDYNPLKPTFGSTGLEKNAPYNFNPVSPLVSIIDRGEMVIVNPFAREVDLIPDNDPTLVRSRKRLTKILAKPKGH